jgi:hypothetical protein
MNNRLLKILVILLFISGFSSVSLTQTKLPAKKTYVGLEKERTNFKELLKQNPNYFGNIKIKAIAERYPAVYKMASNTKYEELVCVGLYPEDNILEATIEVKLPYGFKGSLCKEGSKEYVGFYIDYNDGAGFVSVGAPAEVNVHDISFVNGGYLYYAVRKSFVPGKYTKCDSVQIVKVRAILSWEDLPRGPNHEPVWGNVFDTWVQIKPKEKVFFVPFVPGFKYKYYDIPLLDYDMSILDIDLPEQKVIPFGPVPPVEKYIFMGSIEEIKELIDKSISAEKTIIKKGEVEEYRFEFKKLIMENPNYFGSISTAKNLGEIMKAVYELPEETYKSMIPKLAIDTSWLIPKLTFLKKTKYEELKCVGLYPEEDLLEAVIEVKLPYGFMGDLCTLGSIEYVAFYIDWGSGYQYETTASVKVHNIPAVNSKHLFYAVKAKIPDIDSKLKACTSENIVKVKAVLSWNVDPTPYGHNYNQPWGNTVIKNVQIRPLDGMSVKPDIEIVNSVHADDINQSGMTKGLAIKIDKDDNTVTGVYDRPFGGIIACWGNVNIPGAELYRFRFSDDDGTTWNNITDPRKARGPFGITITITPDSKGWFKISDYLHDLTRYSLTALVHWNSSGKNGNYKIMLQLADGTGHEIAGMTDEVFLVLDNTRPELFEFGGTPAPPIPAVGVTVKDTDGNYRKCETFKSHDTIIIFGNFSDDFFKEFNLTVFGGNITASGKDITNKDFNRYDSGHPNINFQGVIGAGDGSPGKELDSLDLCTIPQNPKQIKCAYGIKLTVNDRSIVGYIRGYEFNTTRYWRDAYVTFEWNPAGCTPTP